jgi:hypothetical protein
LVLGSLAASLGLLACGDDAGASGRSPADEFAHAAAARTRGALAGPALEHAGGEPALLTVRLAAVEDGVALPGLSVYLWRRPGDEGPVRPVARSNAVLGEIPESDAEGTVRYRVPAGRYSVCAVWPPVDAEVVELRAGEGAELLLERRSIPDLAVELRAVAGEAQSVVSASEVDLLGLPPEVLARGGQSTSRAGADGVHHLRVPSWSPVIASVRAEGYGELRTALGTGESEALREVVLEPAASLQGRLVDAAGAPLGGVTLLARADTWELFDSGEKPPHLAAVPAEAEWRTTTRADGSFVLAGLPARAGITLAAEQKQGREARVNTRAPLRLAPGEARVEDVLLASGTRIEGTLFGADGATRPDVTIWLVRGGTRRVFTTFEEVRYRAVTDGGGRFAFENVQPGSWRVGPAAGRADGESGLAPFPEIVEVLPGMTVAQVVLHPPGLLTLEGRCLGPQGEPVSGVHLVAESLEQVATGISGADGVFNLGPFVAGELELRATAMRSGYAAGESQIVQAGDRDVLVRVQRSGSLRGSAVRAASGAGLSAEIELVPQARERSTSARRVTAAPDGSFEIPDLDPGDYILIARADGAVAVRGDLGVRPAEKIEVALELADSTHARFTVAETYSESSYALLWNGIPIEHGSLAGRVEGETRDFPPGVVTLEVIDTEGRVEHRTATATVGRVVELDFRK